MGTETIEPVYWILAYIIVIGFKTIGLWIFIVAVIHMAKDIWHAK